MVTINKHNSEHFYKNKLLAKLIIDHRKKIVKF